MRRLGEGAQPTQPVNHFVWLCVLAIFSYRIRLTMSCAPLVPFIFSCGRSWLRSPRKLGSSWILIYFSAISGGCYWVSQLALSDCDLVDELSIKSNELHWFPVSSQWVLTRSIEISVDSVECQWGQEMSQWVVCELHWVLGDFYWVLSECYKFLLSSN